jgi:anti-anti-sigma regulatory factor
METLLEGIAANQADVALLDISGVRVVDTQVADALLRVAQAAKLLGTQIVLTGIRAEVAQTIVHLGADMSGIVTRSNLQDGLRYALTMAGSDIAPDAAFSRGT